MKKRTIALLMAVVMLFGATVGGTIAWLTAKTDPVVNTFTPSDIAITLTETANQTDGTWKAQVIPGKEYAKNPVVAVNGTLTNVDVYLFVTFDPSTSATYLDYTSNLDGNGWTKLEDGVYYREVKVGDSVKEWHLLANDKVTVKSDLTEDVVDDASFTMTYKAYAIQTVGFANAAAAWTEAKKLG